jgi:hypothetical protein
MREMRARLDLKRDRRPELKPPTTARTPSGGLLARRRLERGPQAMSRHEKLCGFGHFHSERDLCRVHWRQSRLLRFALLGADRVVEQNALNVTRNGARDPSATRRAQHLFPSRVAAPHQIGSSRYRRKRTAPPLDCVTQRQSAANRVVTNVQRAPAPAESHSPSFDQRRRLDALRTAIATAFWPTRTTRRLPRVAPV